MRQNIFDLVYRALLSIGTFAAVFGHTLAQTAETTLQAPSQQRVFSAFRPNRTYPLLDNGFIVSHLRNITHEEPEAVSVISLITGEQLSIPFWLPNAMAVHLEAVAATAHNSVLLAGSYTSSAQDTVPSNFVAEMDFSGHLIATYDLGDYTPERICAASDDTFWTLGQVWNDETQFSNPMTQGSYSLLRHYGSRGALKGQYLPRSILQRSNVVNGTVLNYHAHAQNANVAFLKCGVNSVAAYLGTHRSTFLWYEINAATGSIQRLDVQMPASTQISGLVLLSEHTAYASFRPQGIYQLTLDLASPNLAQWLPVPGSSASSTLLGRDGLKLVYSDESVSTPAKNQAATLYWATPAH